MASITRSLAQPSRLLARYGPSLRTARSFSVSPFRFAQEDPQVPPAPKDRRAEDYPAMPEYSPDSLSEEERSIYDTLSPEEREEFDAENRRLVEDYNDLDLRAEKFAELDKMVNQIEKQEDIRFDDIREKQRGFWGEDEDDEFAQVEDGDEEINDDEITSMAHAEMEVHREMREYARIAAWDMPMLSKLAKPFSLPPQTDFLRFRYTSYMGEKHPAESKVVVELASKDLTRKHLSEEQRQTFLKLVGTRYNPQTDIVRMSCERFPTNAQNKVYLVDVVESLIQEAKTGDSFADIPLDLRHVKLKSRPRFPDSWKMTEERRKQLAARRAERLNAEKERNATVDGNKIVGHASIALPSLNPELNARATEERERVAVKVGARGKRPAPRR